MDRTPRPSLARRLPRAALIALAIALVGGGAIGFAAAAGEDAIAFSLPEPMGGDEAQYAPQSGAEQPLRVDVYAPELLLMRDGSWVGAARMRISQNQSLGDDFSYVAWREAYVDSSTGQVTASAAEDGAFRGEARVQGPGPLDSQFAITKAFSELRYEPGPSPCGARNGLQGATGAVGEEVWVAGCFPDEDRRDFKVDGTEELDGVTALRLSAGGVHLWFQGGIPYPVQIKILGDTWRLTGFVRGQTPIAPIALPRPLVLPPIDLAPRGMLGPDASGFELPFTLEQAFEQARPDLKAFLDSNPDAFVAKADYAEDQGMDDLGREVTERAWDFIVRGTTNEVTVNVVQPRASGGPDDLGYLLEHGLAADDGGLVRVHDETEAEPQTDQCRPDLMPTVASVARRWQSGNGDRRPATGYGFSVGCERNPSAIPEVDAGDVLPHSVSYSAGVQFVLPDEEVYEHKTGLVVRPDGIVDHLWTADVTTTRDTWNDVPAVIPSGQASADAPQPVPTPAWTLPAKPVAASITIVSVLAGVLYWLWPALKAGPLGLFSRLQTPDLLNHPVRKELAQRIEAQPGVHYQDLVRAMGKGKGAIEHHLRKLQEGGHVKSIASAGYTCWFPVAYDRRLVAAAPALKSEGARAVLAAIQARPGTSARDVGLATALSAAAVNHHLQRLSGAGLVHIVRAGRSLSILPTELAGQVGAAAAAVA